MSDEPQTDVTEKKRLQPLPVDPDDLLDWDFFIADPPPPKSKGRIQVTLRYIGRDKPLPVADPREED